MNMNLQMPQVQQFNYGPDWNYISNIKKLEEMKRQREEETQYQNALLRISSPQYEQVPTTVQQVEQPEVTPQEQVSIDIARQNAGITDTELEQPEQPAQEQMKMQAKPFVPSTYMEFKAAQDYSQTFLKQVAPFITKAVDTGNEDWIKAIASKARNTGLKPLAEYADMLDEIKVKGQGEAEWPITLTEQNIDPLYNKYKPALDKAGITREMLSTGKYLAYMKDGELTKLIPDKNASKTANWQRKKFNETVDGKTYEVTVDFNPATREQVEISRVPLEEVAKGSAKRRYQMKPAGDVFDTMTGKSFIPVRDAKGNIIDERISGDEARELNAETKARTSGLTLIDKQLQASDSFIGTIDRNIDQFKSHVDAIAGRLNLDRAKILNMPFREFMNRVKGSSDVAIYDLLINAISTENAKLQSGGAGSVAQVAEGARIEMEKVHNKNMPVSEMLKLLEATRKEGQNRIEALTETRGKASEGIVSIRKKQKERVVTENKPVIQYQIGDNYKGKKIVRLGWMGKSRIALLEGGAQVEIK